MMPRTPFREHLTNQVTKGFDLLLSCRRLHHRAGSSPLELHGTVYSVVCLDCGFSFCRELFQEQVKDLNPKVSVFDAHYLLYLKDVNLDFACHIILYFATRNRLEIGEVIIYN